MAAASASGSIALMVSSDILMALVSAWRAQNGAQWRINGAEKAASAKKQSEGDVTSAKWRRQRQHEKYDEKTKITYGGLANRLPRWRGGVISDGVKTISGKKMARNVSINGISSISEENRR